MDVGSFIVRCGGGRTLQAVVFLSLCVAVCGARGSTNVLEALYDTLEGRGISVDKPVADAAAVAAALATVDARASVVALDDPAVPLTNTPVLKIERWEQKIGYLGVPHLSVAIASNLVQQVVAWEADEGHGIILDLRGTGGDSLDAVDGVAGLLVDDGTPLYDIKDLDGNVLESHSSRGAACCRIPLVVLTDAQTRDAGEVLAATMKKQGGVMLVGNTTLGDATVRRPLPISDRLAVVVAYGKVCLGEDCNYDGVGVLPDVPVEMGATAPAIDTTSQNGPSGRPLTEKALQDRELMKRIENDLVLRRAADILLGLKALGEFETPPPAAGEETRPEDK